MELRSTYSEKANRDYKLVCLARDNNDQKAFNKLMKLYQSSVYFTMLKMTNNREDAKDLTLEAFEKAFSKLISYQPQFCFSTWLFTIATNNCIDFIRKKNDKILSMNIFDEDNKLFETINQVKVKEPNPEEQMIKQQKADSIQEKIKTLNPHYRNLVEMRYNKEMQYGEISDLLKIPLGSIKAQLYRAREILSRSLININEVN